MTRKEIDQKYLDRVSDLEVEFFDIIDQDLPSQHRVLKSGKTVADFNVQHATIWQNHEAELIANGSIEAPSASELIAKRNRDVIGEIRNSYSETDEIEILRELAFGDLLPTDKKAMDWKDVVQAAKEKHPK